MAADTEKLASNFELNVITLGVHRFQLEKGDEFITQGDNFYYNPKGKNKGKGKYTRWSGRNNMHTAKKYMKDVKRADNIKLVEDEPWASHLEGDKRRRQRYVVEYAYEVPAEQHDALFIQIVQQGSGWGNDGDWNYKVEERQIKKITEETIFLEKDCPITYHSKIGKAEIGVVNVKGSGSVYYMYCKMDTFDESEIKLMQGVEQARLKRIKDAEEHLAREKELLGEFMELKKERGY